MPTHVSQSGQSSPYTNVSKKIVYALSYNHRPRPMPLAVAPIAAGALSEARRVSATKTTGTAARSNKRRALREGYRRPRPHEAGASASRARGRLAAHEGESTSTFPNPNHALEPSG